MTLNLWGLLYRISLLWVSESSTHIILTVPPMFALYLSICNFYVGVLVSITGLREDPKGRPVRFPVSYLAQPKGPKYILKYRS